MSAALSVVEEPRGMVPRADLYRALARADALQAELDQLRGEMTRWVGATFRMSIARVGFSKSQATLLAALYQRSQPVNALMWAAEQQSRNEDTDHDNVLKARICILRKRITDMGGPPNTIITHWATGYSLSPEGRDWLAAGIAKAGGTP